MSFFDVARLASAHLTLVSPPRRRMAIEDTFYLSPHPVPPGPPGEILRAERMDAYLVPGVRLRANAWRILYRDAARVVQGLARGLR